MSTEYYIGADRLVAGWDHVKGEKKDEGFPLNSTTCAAAGEVPAQCEEMARYIEDDIEAWCEENPGESPMAHDVHWQITVTVDGDA